MMENSIFTHPRAEACPRCGTPVIPHETTQMARNGHLYCPACAEAVDRREARTERRCRVTNATTGKVRELRLTPKEMREERDRDRIVEEID